MNINKLFYKIIRIPLIFIFIKTPLIKILENRFKKNKKERSNLILRLLDYLFASEYFVKLKNSEKINKLCDWSIIEGGGRMWAEYYYNNHFRTLENLQKRKYGNMKFNEANPIFAEMVNYIKSNKFDEDKNSYIIQIGSSSGCDLEFFYKIFPKINYISTDVSDEIIHFQKEKHKYENFSFFKCKAENIDECFKKYDLQYKKVIIFSSSSLQYAHPYHLEIFFNKLKLLKNLNLFICETVNYNFLEKGIYKSKFIGDYSFSHNYKKYAENFTVLDSKILKPHDQNDALHKFIGIYYLHLRI